MYNAQAMYLVEPLKINSGDGTNWKFYSKSLSVNDTKYPRDL